MKVNTLLVNCTEEQITQHEREFEDDFLPYAGSHEGYRLRIGQGFNLLEDSDDGDQNYLPPDDIDDVRNDEEYNMEMQAD